MNLANEKNASVIYNGIDLERFQKKKAFNKNIRKELQLSYSDILIGSIGDLRKAKGYDVLIDAAALLIRENPRYHFVVAGSITDLLSGFQQKIKQHKIDKHFHFFGHREDVPDILSQLDVFVLPSITEGFSLSTIEAMAVGVPVVATKSGGPEEIITNEKDGVLVNVLSPKEIAEAIKRYIVDLNFRDNVISGALIKVKQKFSIEKMLFEYQTIYNQIVI
jgi:glycosyltransferase involved in cell wall biosynthesis